MQYIETIKNIQPFCDLQKEKMEWVMERIKIEKYQPGEYVFRHGQATLGRLFFVLEGMAEVLIEEETAKEFVVGIRKPGDFFGETGILSQRKYAGSVRALQPLVCISLSGKNFEHLIFTDLDFASHFNTILTHRARSLYEELYLDHSHLASGMESYPFRKKLSEIMTSPVMTCQATDTTDKVGQILSERNISSVLVFDNRRLKGIITEKTLVTKVVTNNQLPRELEAVEVMDENVVTLPPSAFYYQALLSMIKNRVKHVVVSAEDSVLGIVTLRDLIKVRSSGALTIVDRIETEDNLPALKSARQDVDNVLKALFLEKAPIPEICEVITELNDRLVKKIILMAEKEMVEENYGPPPVSYCFIIMGSGGRKEQFFRTDQDNGIIYDNGKTGSCLQQYFLRLGEKIVSGLETCGFKQCNGQVMANNEHGVFSSDNGEIFDTAYRTLLMFRLKVNLNKLGHGYPADNFVKLANFCKQERAVLKDAYLAVKHLQQLTKATFQV